MQSEASSWAVLRRSCATTWGPAFVTWLPAVMLVDRNSSASTRAELVTLFFMTIAPAAVASVASGFSVGLKRPGPAVIRFFSSLLAIAGAMLVLTALTVGGLIPVGMWSIQGVDLVGLAAVAIPVVSGGCAGASLAFLFLRAGQVGSPSSEAGTRTSGWKVVVLAMGTAAGSALVWLLMTRLHLDDARILLGAGPLGIALPACLASSTVAAWQAQSQKGARGGAAARP